MVFFSLRRCDGHLADMALYHARLNQDDPSFMEELERRGYDITTFKLSVQFREHAWVKPHSVIYPKSGGKPSKVDWIRWRGPEVLVYFMSQRSRRGDEQDFESPRFCGRDMCLALAEVERLYQPTPAEDPRWSPDDLPPMFAAVGGVAPGACRMDVEPPCSG